MKLNDTNLKSMDAAMDEIFIDITENPAEFANKAYYEKTAGTITVEGKECQISVKLIVSETSQLDEDELYWKDVEPDAEDEMLEEEE